MRGGGDVSYHCKRGGGGGGGGGLEAILVFNRDIMRMPFF